MLDGVVDGIRLGVGAGNQRHPLAARVPFEVGVDHPLARHVVMVDPLHVPVRSELARNLQRTLAVSRIPQPQRQRRVVGIADPVHRAAGRPDLQADVVQWVVAAARPPVGL
jgi:hypothetical protein